MWDAKSGLPICEVTLTGEQSDVSNLISFLEKVDNWFSLNNSKILAYKGDKLCSLSNLKRAS